MIVVPASLRSDFIHMAGMTIHIALESTIHIVGIRTRHHGGDSRRAPIVRRCPKSKRSTVTE